MTAFLSTARVPQNGTAATGGGRVRPRRWLPLAVTAALFSMPLPIAALDDGAGQQVNVREERGVYTVTARFTVPQPTSAVMAVLTDYEAIPRFLPDLRKSVVLERREGRTVVEQEAVARIMMFSRRVHLLLDVEQGPAEIRFRDRASKSFTRYEGIWRVEAADGPTAVTYELIAQPSFDVPEFILGRLLKRDAKRMIEGLRSEMAARPARSGYQR